MSSIVSIQTDNAFKMANDWLKCLASALRNCRYVLTSIKTHSTYRLQRTAPTGCKPNAFKVDFKSKV